jgi:hypothetical protein
MAAHDEHEAFRRRARAIADADAPRGPSPPAREDDGNPMGGFLLLLRPYRRWVLRVSVAMVAILGAWRLIGSVTG